MKVIQDILVKGAEEIDITPTMYKEASGHYNAMGSFLENNGVEAEISPCGSIVMGTIVRPLPKDDDDYFDIDVIVKRIDLEKNECAPLDVRDPVERILVNSDLYGDKMDKENCDECITLRYVLNGKEGGFRLDLDTCVADVSNPKAVGCDTGGVYAESAVAIARKNSPEWLGSNPRGLCRWLLDKNGRFALSGRAQRKTALFENNPTVYASVDEVPDMMDRSNLQRAVQIAKRSRDEYYRRSRIDDKPASCVLTVLIADISDGLPDDASILDILLKFVDKLEREKLRADLGSTCIVGRKSCWRLDNPVYDENMLEGWKDSDASTFFKWIEDLRRCLEDLQDKGAKRESAASALLGNTVGTRILSATEAVVASVASDVIPRKPWRNTL